MSYTIEELNGSHVDDPSLDYGTPELNNLTYKIIGASMEIYNTLGKGFSEKAYQDCLCVEFESLGISYEREKKFEIIYKGVKIAHHYYADFIIENSVVLETKAHATILEDHTKQVLNYLAISKCKVGLIINFGEDSLKFKRVILSK